MQLLTFVSSFVKSRQKVLLKRRKIQIKNRPLSKKYLKEEQKVMNYSFESKLMDIKKALDKKKSQNHHINQIIEQLFYPDIHPQHSNLIESQLKQSTNNLHLHPQQFQSYLKEDQLAQSIKETLLPIDLLQLHRLNQQHFQLSHYQYLLKKLNYSVQHASQIKHKLHQKWNKQMLRSKDVKGKNSITNKPNFVLLQSDQIIRHELWSDVIIGIHNKMKTLKTNLPAFNQYIKIVLLISKYFKFIPASLYQLIITTNISFPFQELRPADISRLANLLRLRYHVRYQPHIKIQNPQQAIPKESHISFLRNLSASIITNFHQYKPIDFINIFHIVHAYQKKVVILSEDFLNHSEYIFTSIINQLTFQQVQMYLNIYMHQKLNPNMDFISIVKFDLFRKCQSCTKEVVLLNLMTRIKGRKLIYKNNKGKVDSQCLIQIQGHDLILKLSQTISKSLAKLSSLQIIKLIDIYYSNEITQQSLLLILSTQFIKKCISINTNNNQNINKLQNNPKLKLIDISLQSIGKSLFKLTLLGYRSRMIARLVFQQFIQRYNIVDKQYRNRQVLLLPSDVKYNTPPYNFKVIHLQECLLMALWAIIKQLADQQHTFDKKIRQQMLSLIPLKIDSLDPLAIELIININHLLKPFNLYPTIPIPIYTPHTFPIGRHNQLYKPNFSKTPIQKLMHEQASLSSTFIQNYNYKQNFFLHERWSMLNTYKPQQYIQYCKHQQNQTKCYFNHDIRLPQQFLERRKMLIRNNVNIDKQTSSYLQQKKQYKKIYDLLL